MPDVKGVIEYLTRNPFPRRVFVHLRPGHTAPTTPTALAERHFDIRQHSMQGWYDNGIPQDRLDRLAQWYGFDSTIWEAWATGDKGQFEFAYKAHWDPKLTAAEQEPPPTVAPPPATGPRLRRVTTGKDDHPVESLGAIDVSATGQLVEGEHANFSGVLICRPATVGSVRLAVKFCKVRLTRISDTTADLYDSERLRLVQVQNDRGAEVEVRPVGSGRPPTFEIQALSGAIEMVSLPDDIWRIPGLKRGDRFVVEVVVLLRDCTRLDGDGADDAEPDPESPARWDDGNSFYRPGFKALGRALETIQQRYEQLRLADWDEDWGVLHRTRFVLEVMP